MSVREHRTVKKAATAIAVVLVALPLAGSPHEAPGGGGDRDQPLMFCGYPWTIKASARPSAPGPNLWSRSPANVWVDSPGLHLRITLQNGRGICSEVILDRSLGYGEYTFQIASRVDDLDGSTVAAPFLYESNSREIDIEFAGDAMIEGGVNAQYVVQPYTRSGNVKRFTMPPAAQSTHRIDWRPDRVEFSSWEGFGPPPAADSGFIERWIYAGPDNPPAGNERLHINIWLFRGATPARADELVIRCFTFAPL